VTKKKKGRTFENYFLSFLLLQTMTLPPLRDTTVSDGVHRASYSCPPPLSQPRVSMAPSTKYEELQLPALTATSLRPARPSRASHSVHLSAPSEGAENVSEQPHPLLQQVLTDFLVEAAFATSDTPLPPALDAAPSLPSVDEAINEVGGANKMAMLLQELHAAPHQQQLPDEKSSSLDMPGVLQDCVQRTLSLPGDAVHVSCPSSDPSVFHVRIPLPTTSRAEKKGVPLLRPCLLVRVHQRRGVLSLHVVNIRYEGPDQRVAARPVPRRPHKSVKLKSLARVPQQEATSTRVIAATAEASASTTPPGEKNGLAQPPSSPPTLVGNGLDYAQLRTALGQPFSAEFSTKAQTAQLSTSGTPQTSRLSRGTAGTFKVAKRPRDTRGRRTPSRRSHARDAVVEFDPLHPEETTPFNAEHRPLTFNAAIVFS
jgi:hypothetical protein